MAFYAGTNQVADHCGHFVLSKSPKHRFASGIAVLYRGGINGTHPRALQPLHLALRDNVLKDALLIYAA